VLGTYYEAYNNVYGELSYYTRLDDMRQLYQKKEQYYKQLMFDYLPATSESCFLRREQAAQAEGKLKEAMAINDEWMKTVEPGSHPYALTALYRYIEYKLQSDTTQMLYWLTESVLADIRNAAMDQGSMWGTGQRTDAERRCGPCLALHQLYQRLCQPVMARASATGR